MDASDDITTEVDQGRIKQRIEAMGIRAQLMPGGRCVLATMQATGRPLETLNGSLPLPEIVFATVGRDRIKCLFPEALFVLPLIRMADCKSAISLEGRIRASFSNHMDELHKAESWLRDIGSDVSAASNGTTLSVSIAGEGHPLKVRVREPRTVILPSRGPLSGVTLMRAEDRCLEIDPCVDSAVDFEIDISTRLDELASIDRRLKEDERRRGMSKAKAPPAEPAAVAERALRILLVGQQLSRERSCIDSLRLRNYEVELARSLNEAIDFYDRTSPELVIADMSLGRSEGVELIPALRAVMGIEEIPVILVDNHRNNARRAAAQQAGAIGYLNYPIDVSRIASRLEEMIKRPKRRRFTRYSQHLAVKIQGAQTPSTALAIGRGGVMIRTDDALLHGSVQRCDLTLPAVGKQLQFDAEVLYQVHEPGRQGVGLRFQSMTPNTEANLINYLYCLQ